jgi:SAM-dependent methyltransferase
MLDLWRDPWPLNVAQCPCDVHFTEWMAQEGRTDATVFHFGTGDHHHVGKTLAMNGSDCAVTGITATKPEYVSYIDMIVNEPRIGKRYKVLFSDIYQLEPRLLPDFDIVTLFHLCEFWSETNAPFANMKDEGVLDAMAAKVKPGGALLFFTGSFAFSWAEPLIGPAMAKHGFGAGERYESLLVYRRLG